MYSLFEGSPPPSQRIGEGSSPADSRTGCWQASVSDDEKVNEPDVSKGASAAAPGESSPPAPAAELSATRPDSTQLENEAHERLAPKDDDQEEVLGAQVSSSQKQEPPVKPKEPEDVPQPEGAVKAMTYGPHQQDVEATEDPVQNKSEDVPPKLSYVPRRRSFSRRKKNNNRALWRVDDFWPARVEEQKLQPPENCEEGNESSTKESAPVEEALENPSNDKPEEDPSEPVTEVHCTQQTQDSMEPVVAEKGHVTSPTDAPEPPPDNISPRRTRSSRNKSRHLQSSQWTPDEDACLCAYVNLNGASGATWKNMGDQFGCTPSVARFRYEKLCQVMSNAVDDDDDENENEGNMEASDQSDKVNKACGRLFTQEEIEHLHEYIAENGSSRTVLDALAAEMERSTESLKTKYYRTKGTRRSAGRTSGGAVEKIKCTQSSVQAPKIASRRKRKWTEEETDMLLCYVAEHGQSAKTFEDLGALMDRTRVAIHSHYYAKCNSTGKHGVEREDNTSLQDASLHLVPLEMPVHTPKFPSNVAGLWKFDAASRIVYADFSGLPAVPRADRECLLRLMEDDTLTVISKGLYTPESSSATGISVDYVRDSFGADTPHFKIRKFSQATDSHSYREHKKFEAMTIADFAEYWKKRCTGQRKSFSYKKIDANDRLSDTVEVPNVQSCSFYLIDCDIPKRMTELEDHYSRNFKVPEILPAGRMCLMHKLPKEARPFMGPNLYMSPPGGYTSFHQDGFGTVDSGHTCLAGFNEVVILRRLPEEHKLNAMQQVSQARSLYGLPHDQTKQLRSDQEIWPNEDNIKEWRRMGYCPTVFVLQKGEHMHINKGRFHCFRKMARDKLLENDCHFSLRNEIHEKNGTGEADEIKYMCCSIAFDWIFRGFSSHGITQEVSSSIDCSHLCRKANVQPLAIPSTCLLHLAKTLHNSNRNAVLDTPIQDLCRGILPPLRRLIVSQTNPDSGRSDVSCSPVPDLHRNSDLCPVDAMDAAYICQLCSAEIVNEFFHCMGCETLLQKDLNICPDCHTTKAYEKFCPMSSNGAERAANANHHVPNKAGRGDQKKKKNQKCACKYKVCPTCKSCMKCSCRCHEKFRRQLRFNTDHQMKEILARCERLMTKVPDVQTDVQEEEEDHCLAYDEVVMVDLSEYWIEKPYFG